MKNDEFEPKILAFCCHYCAYAAADLAGTMRIQYPPNVRIVRTPCTGRLETEYFLKAFENGADGVLVAGCLEGGCHFTNGNLYGRKRVESILDTTFIGILEEQGVWTEKCAACGACVLHEYGGICRVTRCAKRMLNGPCGGSCEDRCEVRPDVPCAWQLIYTRLKEIDQLNKLRKIAPPKNWNRSLDGGQRIVVRQDHRI